MFLASNVMVSCLIINFTLPLLFWHN